MRKKLLIMTLALVALLGLATVFATAASTTVFVYVDGNQSTAASQNRFNTLDEAWSYANGSSVPTGATVQVVLQSNATMPNQLHVNRNIIITSMTGSVYTINSTYSGGSNDAFVDLGAFLLNNGNSLTLRNVTINRSSSTSGAAVSVYSGHLYLENGATITGNTGSTIYVEGSASSFTMRGGSITGNTSNGYGGGVYIYNYGTFTMEGGTISNNTATNYGGGVYISTNVTATMKGGTIQNNKTTNNDGGGVYIYSTTSTFNMTGGTITGNTAASSGGGVGAYWGGTFNMTGGEITNNTAGVNGGGVYMSQGFGLNMNNATITGNTARTNGGGVYVENGVSGHTYSMTNSTVTGNTVNGSGGGVYITNGVTFTMNNGTISGNTANSSGGGVHVNNSGSNTFTMTGGTITSNHAVTGGGVYINANSTFNLSGVAVIKGNDTYGSGSPSNVYLVSGRTISLTGALTSGAEVWVNYPNTQGAVFATATRNSSDATASVPYFYDDNNKYFAMANGNSLIWSVVAAEIWENGMLTGRYTTLSAAIAAYMNFNTQTILLKSDITTPITVDRDLYLDLNGKNITGTLTVSSGKTLYGLDSTTDSYEGNSYGRITGTITGTVALITQTGAAHTTKPKTYLKVTEAGGTSFHRFNVQVSDYYFRLAYGDGTDTSTDTAIMNFTSAVQGDSHVADAITSLQMSSSTTGQAEINTTTQASTLTDLKSTLNSGNPFHYGSHFITVGNPYTAQYALKASLNITLSNGQAATISTTKNRTLKDILGYFYKAADTTQDQKDAIDAFLKRHSLGPIPS